MLLDSVRRSQLDSKFYPMEPMYLRPLKSPAVPPKVVEKVEAHTRIYLMCHTKWSSNGLQVDL